MPLVSFAASTANMLPMLNKIDAIKTLAEIISVATDGDMFKLSRNQEGQIIIGSVVTLEQEDLDVINKYASIPSRETLLTQLAGGMIQYVKDLSIALNLYAEELEK